MRMLDSINLFVDTMLEEQNNFENMQNTVQEWKDQVSGVLKTLEYHENKVIEAIEDDIVKSHDQNMKEIFSKTSEALSAAMIEADKKIDEAVNGMKFIEDFDKHFTVSVFGKVKAGKSYLGNLLMGYPLRNAGIPSSYDKIKDFTVHVYDKGKLYEQHKLSTAAEKECNGKEFYVDKNEATSTIQWVNIGGMCWFDTPGIGSVTIENEELAKEYVQNSDLVIFACNSDAAGTRQEFYEIKQLHDMNKPLLLLLTQSDTYDYDVDDEGEEINILIPKSEEDRKEQENYMLETLREQGMEDVLKYADILTVSALLATEALENDNEEMFEQSNIGKLLEKLTSITQNDAADIKRNTPKDRINKMIDSIVSDLGSVSDKISEYCSQIRDCKEQLEDREDDIVERIKASLQMKVDEILGSVKSLVEQTGQPVSEREISDQINEAAQNIIQKVCSDEAIRQSDSIPDIEIKLSGIGTMKMQQDRIPYEYVSVRQVERDPSGFGEKALAFIFKKQFYTSETKTETKYSIFDIGVNDDEIAHNIVVQLDRICAETVKDYINYLVEGYYKPVEKLQRETVDLMNKAITALEGMRM
ncbi:MAG: 50S ribosome-binding GTPase [Eubacteriales bacterium]|nr:50S ribosome-binding GTPase [Eubacteriales bacterium]